MDESAVQRRFRQDAHVLAEIGRYVSSQLQPTVRPSAGVGLKGRAGLATVMDHVEPQAAAVMRRPGGATPGLVGDQPGAVRRSGLAGEAIV